MDARPPVPNADGRESRKEIEGTVKVSEKTKDKLQEGEGAQENQEDQEYLVFDQRERSWHHAGGLGNEGQES